MSLHILLFAVGSSALVGACRFPVSQAQTPAAEIDFDAPVGVELVWKAELSVLRATYEPCKPTRSIGKPWRGRLACGLLPVDHPRLWPRTRSLYGTAETQTALGAVAARLEAIDPDGPPIELFDISTRDGGKTPFHASHQSGRDVDLGYFYVDGFEPGPYFDVPSDKLDAPRTWKLIQALLDTGEVKLILVDHAHQQVLHAAAAAAGTKKLKRLFQYPRGPKDKGGIIRHYPSHRSHMHVRFRCPRRHQRCKS